ncbi:MAG: hypothetical protein KAJ75_06800 [Alphaproteobacteria bacterium]|nr:hypothetical protein [Alphaproteobacteria bacterium]
MNNDTTPVENNEADENRKKRTLSELLDIIHGLSDLLEKENDALKKHELEIVKELLERKTFLTRSYQEHIIAMNKNPDIIQSQNEEQKESLKVLAVKLEKLSGENDKLLKANIDAGGQLLEAIVQAAKSVHEKDAVYSVNGSKIEKKKNPKALSFNKTI